MQPSHKRLCLTCASPATSAWRLLPGAADSLRRCARWALVIVWGSTANLLCERAGAIVAERTRLKKLVSVENPANSYFWKTSGWVSQTQGLTFQEVVFHNCQHGGQRPKATRLAHNIDLLHELHLMCPGESPGHQHLPWSRDGKSFATSKEKVYPWTLCRRIADIILRTLLNKGFQAPPDSMQPGASAQHVEAAAATNTQPRGKKLPPLVPEFAQVVTITCSEPLFPGITKLEIPETCLIMRNAQPPSPRCQPGPES